MNNATQQKIPVPTLETLKRLSNLTYTEVCSLILHFDKIKEESSKFTRRFLRDSIQLSAERVLAINLLSARFLNDVFTIQRVLLEANVDLLWLYSHFLNNPENAEKIAKRFFQFAADSFVENSEYFKLIEKDDPFIGKVKEKVDFDKQVESAKNLNLIQILDPNANKDLQKLQRSDWRALPNVIQSGKEISFRKRAEIAADIIFRISKLQHAPYFHNWKVLCNFAHWSGLQYRYIDEELAEQLYIRSINISLGFVHDMINVCFDFLKIYFPDITIPESVRAIRLQFHWFKT